MNLADLVGDIDGITSHPAGGARADVSPVVSGLTADSREVQSGFLFAALDGLEADGAAFIPQAIANGAHAILGRPGLATEGLPYLEAREPRQALAHLAARFFPNQPKTICAVTGTNGKTSVASFVRQIWSRQGKRAASIGTLGVVTDQGQVALQHTTPDPVQLHKILHDLSNDGVTHVVLEASSHALAQCRLDGVRITAAALTNITRDHLDYHDTFESYESAKLRLFGELISRDGRAVINADSASAPVAAAQSSAAVTSVGAGKADIRVTSLKPDQSGTNVTISYEGKKFAVRIPLIGAFQISNALIAGALSGALPADWLPLLEQLEGAEGRMQKIGAMPNGASIYVDYAHTPDALETVLRAIRPHAEGRLVVLFGCGGDRDEGKRPLMGGIATAFADVVYVTDDNPRHEDAQRIRDDILAAAPAAIEIGDRREAILSAMAGLKPEDVLVVAGKGHEAGQTVRGVTHPFKDADVIADILHHHSQAGVQ